jgi:hypothetical protein
LGRSEAQHQARHFRQLGLPAWAREYYRQPLLLSQVLLLLAPPLSLLQPTPAPSMPPVRQGAPPVVLAIRLRR